MKQTDPSGAVGHSAATEGEAVWRRSLGELALSCAGSFPADEAQRLRDLRDLLAQAPTPSLARGVQAIPAERLDALFAAEATASAALALVGDDCGYLISRGAGGQFLVSIILPGAAEETSASGDTLALALTGAIALALAEAECADPERPRAEGPARLN